MNVCNYMYMYMYMYMYIACYVTVLTKQRWWTGMESWWSASGGCGSCGAVRSPWECIHCSEWVEPEVDHMIVT